MADTSIIIESGFFDSINRDRLYSADDMNKPYKDLISEGVYGAIVGTTSTAFAVTAGSGLAVSVAAGKALLGGRWVNTDEAITLEVPAASAARIDSVILRVDSNNSARNASLIYRTGSASAAPALVTSTGITELRLANISLASGATAIAAGAITDERTFAKLNVSKDQLEEVLVQIINDHPELVTTVPDGSITTEKLAASLAAQIAANTQGISDVNDALSTKAENDGYYEEMTVGDAEQLVSTQYVEDEVPYKFRTTGGSADVGNRAYVDKIVGGSLVWNQLVTPRTVSATVNGIAFTSNADGFFTANGEATADAVLQVLPNAIIPTLGHKYFLAGCPKNGSSTTYSLNTSRGEDFGNGIIFNNTDTSKYIWILVKSGTTVNNLVFKPMLIDLTQIFGSTIADYIYNLEQSTAGAGVAWFRKYFPSDYYEFNAGEMIHVAGLSSHDTVGFNQWDEEWEVGYISETTGADSPNNAYMRAKNYTPCFGNTAYCCTKPSGQWFAIYWYDANKNYISYEAHSVAPYVVRTSPSNAQYFRISSNVATYNNDICINLSWSGTRNGEYEPYQKHSYALDDSLTLRGIPKIDSNGNLYYDGDEYAYDGTVTRKYGIVDLGTLNWGYNAEYGFYCSVANVNPTPKGYGGTELPNARMSNGFSGATIAITGGGYDKAFAIGTYIYISDSAYTDAASFKTAMSGVYLVYELATPTEETAEPYNEVQIVDDWGTEEFVSTTIVSVGHETRYPQNLRDKLQHLPNLASADGDYAIRQTGSQMALVPLQDVKELPTVPSADGVTYLKCTVANGVATLSWETIS